MLNAGNSDRARLRSLRIKVREKRHESDRDNDLLSEVEEILENVEEFMQGGGADERRGLFVTGHAGTGKTTALKYVLGKVPELQPYRNEFNELVRPCISIKLPKECKPLNIVQQVLQALDIPHKGSEKVLTPLMMEQLKERRVYLLHLDEAQHTVRSNTTKAFEAVQDLVKQMIDRDDWPLHVILSGMPRIEAMREDEQIGRRSRVFPFHRMTFEADAPKIAELVREIAEIDCGLSLAKDVQTSDFLARLSKTTHGAWGTVICDTRNACFRALRRGKELTIKHFAQEYERNTGALLTENIFMSDRWEDLDVKKTLKAMVEEND